MGIRGAVKDIPYLMESEDETVRLDVKTDPAVVEEQGLWAGARPGMRVADLGCGSGKTTSVLHRLVQPGGSSVGVDFSRERIDFARSHYGAEGPEFVCEDIRLPLDALGQFDLLWIRFVLEYYRSNSMEIVRNVWRMLKPGGTLCLIDLDHNSLNHFQMPEQLEKAMFKYMRFLEEKYNFDPYAGRKLYSYLFDLGCEDMVVRVGAHHVIYGELGGVDGFNWMKKVEMATGKTARGLGEFKNEGNQIAKEFGRFFSNPRRFSYTPLICARGRKAA